MRALVTGGSGFVGTWLCAHLRSQADDVVSIDHEVDVTEAREVATAVHDTAPEVVYHLAAKSHVGSSWDDPEGVVRVNTIGTLNVLEAARRCEAPPVVLLVSSAEVYGAPKRLPVSEESPLVPVTPYAASKAAAEIFGVQAHAAHGLRVVRVRPFNHIGPGQSAGFVVSALAKRIVEAERDGASAVSVGNLEVRRDLTDVRDVVVAYRRLANLGVPGEVYNVCSGRDIAVSEIAEMLLNLVGTPLELVPDPSLMRPVDVPVVRGERRRVSELTGWEPQVDLVTTLADVLDHWRQHVTEGSTGQSA